MIDRFFPTFLYRANLGPLVNNEYIYKKALQLKSENKTGHSWDSGVYNSLDSVNIQSDPWIDKLITMTQVHIHQFLSEIKSKSYSQIECRDCWVNVYEKGDYQEIHTHANSHISVVYYVKVPQNSGQIIFSNPTYLTDSLPIEDNESVRYTPAESDILVFRSSVPHRVSRNTSDDIRVSVALNFLLK